MMFNDIAIPTLPSHNLPETLEFYRQLGFQSEADPVALGDYLMIYRDALELHFFNFPEIVPAESYAGCYLRVSQVDELFQEFQALSLPSEGIPRLGAIANHPWGMREFHIVDPSGNLLRIGQVLPAD